MFRRQLSGIALALTATLLTSGASASPISALQARQAMTKWIRARPAAHMNARLGEAVSVRTVTAANGANLFYVVQLKGGGFVVTPADDRIQPVVAFSDSGTLDASERNPLWCMLNQDLPKRLEAVESLPSVRTSSASSDWSDLLADDSGGGIPILSVGLTYGEQSIADVRVPILLETKWNQTTDKSNALCYNYYTPNNYYCGCVATATAQLMRKHQFPTTGVSPQTFSCWVGSDVVSKTMMGGTYDWSAMPGEPGDGTTEAERQAIGKLCYDVGVASRMQWTSSGSGACLLQTAISLVDVFGYANARSIQLQQTATSAQMQAAIFANLDAGYPVLLGIRDSRGKNGHAIVADGYGYSGSTPYTHLNLGWAGNSDAWYALPEIGTIYDFSVVDTIVYNVFVDQTGELLTGRITDSSGNPVAGAAVTVVNASNSEDVRNVTSNEKGIYAAHVTSGNWRVSVSAEGFDTISNRAVSVAASVSTSIYEIGAGSYSYYLNGSVGNSWGNDFAFGTESEPDPEPVVEDLYVDCAYGNDSNDGKYWYNPKRTIQAAIDAAVDGATIYVAPGAYAPFESDNRPLRIESEYGAYNTGINGKGQACCADMGYAAVHTNTVLVGFTLYNGMAQCGGGASGGRLYRCLVTCNEATEAGGGLYNSEAYDCEISYNLATSFGGGAYYGKLVNCTVVENQLESGGEGGGTIYGTVINSIVWGNTVGGVTNNYLGGVYAFSMTSPDRGGDNFCEDPRFFSPDTGDFSLRYDSPCLDAGDNDAVVDDWDLGAWSRIINGTVDLGAYEGVTLDVPTGVSATDGTSSSAVTITWNAVPGATTYSVWRTTRSSFDYSGEPIGTTDGLSFSDASCATWTTYYYWVSASSDVGSGLQSACDAGYRYAAGTYRLRYAANGGYGTMATQIRSTTDASALVRNAYARSGYAFMGWATAPADDVLYRNGETVLVTDEEGASVTIYAVWAPCDANGFVVEDNVVTGWISCGSYDVVVPQGVTAIADYVFEGSALTSIDLPDSVIDLGPSTFEGCSQLTNLTFRGRASATYASDKWGSDLTNDRVWVMAKDFDYWSAIWGNDIGVIGSSLGTVTKTDDGYEMTLSESGESFTVDSDWLVSSGVDTSGGVTAGLMSANGANGIPRYLSYLLGLEPESDTPAEEQLEVSIAFDDNGLPFVTCEPTSAYDFVTYTTLGKESLTNAVWTTVTDDNRAAMKFFKVQVEVR